MATGNEASEQANRSGMDPHRLVVIFYLIAVIVVGMFLGHLLGQVWSRFGWWDHALIEGLDESKLTNVLGALLAVGGAVVAYVHPRSRQLSLEVASELMKVSWPSWEETRVSTLAVVMASLVSAMILFGIDTFAYKLMVEWIPAVWKNL